MDKLITVDHAIDIVEETYCMVGKCNVIAGRKCPEDCKALALKQALKDADADADAVLVALAVDARLV